jgi:hypothetical protein
MLSLSILKVFLKIAEVSKRMCTVQAITGYVPSMISGNKQSFVHCDFETSNTEHVYFSFFPSIFQHYGDQGISELW